MPYNNQYNSNVAQVVRSYSKKHINRENAINDFSTSYAIPSMLEASVLKEPEVHGGSGFAAATVQDLGIEPTLGATSGEGKVKRVRKRVIDVGEGLSAAGVSAGKRVSKKGGALLSLKDLGAMHGQPGPTIQAKVTVKAEGIDRIVGGGVSGGMRRKRIEIVKDVMKKHGLGLIAASKYVKEHKLY